MRGLLSSSVAGLVFALGAAAAPCACSSSSSTNAQAGDGGGDGGASGDDASDDGGTGYAAPHPPMPQAKTLKGPVMTAPNIVTITFQGDPLQGDIDTFVSQMVAAKTYWSGVTAEYGVGPLSATAPVHLTEAAPTSPITDAQVQGFLTAKIAGGGGFPQPDGNTMYAVFYPQGSDVTDGAGHLCNDYQGYHADYALAASPTGSVSYIVVGRCPPPVKGLAEIDEVTAEASHELIEAATDPLPKAKAAYIDVDEVGQIWAMVGGGAEIGDLCAPFPNAFYRPSGVSNLVARVWSNTAAANSHDPCEPDGTTPYFNSAPVVSDTIVVNNSPVGAFTTKGVHIPVGSSQTIELDLYSDAPTSGPWKVSALDLVSMFYGGSPALSFTMDKTQGQNGDKIQLTIKALAKSPVGVAPFWIQNDLGDKSTVRIGAVGN